MGKVYQCVNCISPSVGRSSMGEREIYVRTYVVLLWGL